MRTDSYLRYKPTTAGLQGCCSDSAIYVFKRILTIGLEDPSFTSHAGPKRVLASFSLSNIRQG